MPRKFKDITGQRFGRLIALELVPDVINGHHRTYWKFQCDCGKTITARIDGVINGNVKSCGCYQKDVLSERMKGGNNTSFKKGFQPHNKGRKQSEWMPEQTAQRIKEIATANINKFCMDHPEHIKAVCEANKKPVVQLTILGSVVAFHDSVDSASKSINRTPSSVSRVCCHRGISSGGYGFVFLDEYLSNRVPTTNIDYSYENRSRDHRRKGPAKNFKIGGVWVAPPEDQDMRDWLNEPIAIAGLTADFEPRRYIRRFERIERIRRNGRGAGKTLASVAAEIDRLNNLNQK